MMIEFFTKEDMYLLKNDRVFRNGEVIAKGKIYIQRLIFGQPSYIIVFSNINEPPFVLQTGVILAVLPLYEHINGAPLVEGIA